MINCIHVIAFKVAICNNWPDSGSKTNKTFFNLLFHIQTGENGWNTHKKNLVSRLTLGGANLPLNSSQSCEPPLGWKAPLHSATYGTTEEEYANTAHAQRLWCFGTGTIQNNTASVPTVTEENVRPWGKIIIDRLKDLADCRDFPCRKVAPILSECGRIRIRCARSHRHTMYSFFPAQKIGYSVQKP